MKALPGGKEFEEEKVDSTLKYYGGNSGYISGILQDKTDRDKKIPGSVGKCFEELALRYKLPCPGLKEICRLLAEAPEPVTAKQICLQLDIHISELIDHLVHMQPLLNIENPGGREAYKFFIPAFSDYIVDMTGGM